MTPVVPKPLLSQESGVGGAALSLCCCVTPSKKLSLSELEVPYLGKEQVGHEGLLTDCCCGMLKGDQGLL